VDTTEYVVIAIVTMAGLMRGITGFGGAMLMAPLLSAILGPVATVLTALLLETSAGLVMVPDAWSKIDRKLLSYLIVPACITVPIGGHLLLNLDPGVTRKAISGLVVLFSVVLLCGFRYSGSPRPSISIGLGALLGLMLGATSVGAPPVILYLLAGPWPPAVTRANLTVLVTVISGIGVIMLLLAGAVTTEFAGHAALLALPYLAATWIGGHLFTRLNEFGARRVTLGLALISGIAGFVV
jgi:uncharacterized membrane protein YfcA